MQRLLTAEELAELLNVRPSTIHAWYRRGEIPGRKVGKRFTRFCLADVMAALGLEQPATPNQPEAAAT